MGTSCKRYPAGGLRVQKHNPKADPETKPRDYTSLPKTMEKRPSINHNRNLATLPEDLFTDGNTGLATSSTGTFARNSPDVVDGDDFKSIMLHHVSPDCKKHC
jgi:hypothetical protein